MKITGQISNIENKDDTVSITFVRDDAPTLGDCTLSLPKNAWITTAFNMYSPSTLAFETNDDERPRVINAKINGIRVYKK